MSFIQHFAKPGYLLVARASFVASLVTSIISIESRAQAFPQTLRHSASIHKTFHDLETQLGDRTNDQVVEFFERNIEKHYSLQAFQRELLIAEILEQRKDWNRANSLRQQIAKRAGKNFGPRHWTTRLVVELCEHTTWLSKLESSRQTEYLKVRRRILELEEWMERNPWDIDLKRSEWEQIASELEPYHDPDHLIVSIVSLRRWQTVLAQSKVSPQTLAELQKLENSFRIKLGASPYHAQCHHLISQLLHLKEERSKALRHAHHALRSFKNSGVAASDIQFNLAAIDMANIGFTTGQISQAKQQLQLVIRDCQPHGFLQQLVCAEAYFQLASFDRALGDFIRTKEHFESAIIILTREVSNRAKTPQEARELRTHYMERLGGLNEMGAFGLLGGTAEKARKYFATDAALKLKRNTNPAETAYALLNLAYTEILIDGASLEHAKNHLERAQRLLEDLETHQYLRDNLRSKQALIARKQGDLPMALDYYRSIIDTYRDKGNPQAMRRRSVLGAFTNAWQVEWKLGRKKQAHETCLEFLEVCYPFTIDQLPHVPVDVAQQDLLGLLWQGTENLLAMADENDSDSLKQAMEWICTTKGLATESEKQVLVRLRALAKSRKHATLIKKFYRARAKVVHILLHDYQRISKRQSEIRAAQKELEVLHNQILVELNRDRTKQRLRPTQFSIDRLLSQIPPGTAYVDFLTAREPHSWTTTEELDRSKTLVAMVVWKPSQREATRIRLVRLAKYSQVAGEIRKWQANYSALNRPGVSPPKAQQRANKEKLRESSRRLYALLWSEIAPLIGEMEQVVISPVESLWQIPFAALLDPETDQYLIARQPIAVVHNARQFVHVLERPIKRPRSPLIVGGMDYGQTEYHASAEVTTFAFQRLRHSMVELQSVAQPAHGWDSVKCMSSTAVTESTVVDALVNPQYDLVHLVTHTFAFSMDKQFEQLDQMRNKVPTSDTSNTFGLALGSILRQRQSNAFAGIALSGANDAKLGDADDQILSAEEIELLDLSHLRFVAISGCNSSQGFATWYEGVFGLQRSFYLAGVHSSLGSFWEINDERSAKFMERFYIHYRQHGKATALAKTQREFYEAGAPISNWAAWQIFGDWR